MDKKWTFEYGEGKEMQRTIWTKKVRPFNRIVDFTLKILKSQSGVACEVVLIVVVTSNRRKG